MASVVKIKRSTVQGKAPTTSDLQTGEIAVNLRDGKIFSNDGSAIVELGSNTATATVGSLKIGNTNPYSFPTSDGSKADQVLVTDGAGTLTFSDQGGTEATANAAGASAVTVDSFAKADFRSCQYFTQIVSIDGIQMSQLHVVHTSNTAFAVEFGVIRTTAGGINLGTFDADTSGSNVRLRYTPASGVYLEEFPITIPQGVTVKGTGIRSVSVSPTTETRYNDAFLLNGETTVEDLTVTGFYSGGTFTNALSGGTGDTLVNVGTAPFAHTYVSGGTIEIAGTEYNSVPAISIVPPLTYV